MLVLFDLPVTTKKERKDYSKFRTYLIKRGFFMIQYSIYTKILANREKAVDEKKAVIKNIPKNGNIRIMILTEKQYASMEIIVGGKSNQEIIVTEEEMIII